MADQKKLLLVLYISKIISSIFYYICGWSFIFLKFKKLVIFFFGLGKFYKFDTLVVFVSPSESIVAFVFVPVFHLLFFCNSKYL